MDPDSASQADQARPVHAAQVVEAAPGAAADQAPDRTRDEDFMRHLRDATSFHVEQHFEPLELVGWESVNSYTVRDQAGAKILYVGERSGCCERQLLACTRPLALEVRDTAGRPVLTCHRACYCHCLCGLWRPDRLAVSAADGRPLGAVEKEFSLLYPRFRIKDAAGATVLRVKGPLCTVALDCAPVVFRLVDERGRTVGDIQKRWSGCARELFTDADSFSVSFSGALDAATKAVCLAALFLIDYEYFEDVTIKALALCKCLS